MTDKAPTIALIAGEPSGDALGAPLMAALTRHYEGQGLGKPRFIGIGGPRMEAEGMASLFPMEELTLFGALEVVPKIPHLLKRMGETAAYLKAEKPDVLITIDAPDFSFRVCKRVVDAGFPLVHYVAPTVWAWRAGRAAKIAKFLDHLLCILPFEPPYFEAEGLSASFIGHSVVESGVMDGQAKRFRALHNIADDTQILTILPGSRNSETSRLLPIFTEALRGMGDALADTVLAVPTLPARRAAVEAAAAKWPGRVILFDGLDQPQKFDALAASRAALAASGTVGLELALAGVPCVIAYRLNALTFQIAKRLVRVKYANLVNICLDKPVVPELLQDACTPDVIRTELARLLSPDSPAAKAQITAGQQVAKLLGHGGPSPSARAAEVISELIAKRSKA